jgi:hypothetical protein
MKKRLSYLITILFGIIVLFSNSCSDPSNDVGGNTTIDNTPPDEITYPNANSGDKEIVLLWKDPANTDFNHVEITHNQTGGIAIVSVEKGIETYAYDNLTNDVEYIFTVKTVDANGNKSNGITVACVPSAIAPADGSGFFVGSQWQDVSFQSGDNIIIQSMNWLKSNSVDNGIYTIKLNRGVALDPVTLDGFRGNDIILILTTFDSTEQILQLNNTNGSLFVIGSQYSLSKNIKLIIDGHITLKGRSDNNASLVRVFLTGKFQMDGNSKLEGNTSSLYGGGVYVDDGGEFIMNSGKITGNTAKGDSYAYGGGVYVHDYVYNSKFTMNGGFISGNTVAGSGGSCGGGVAVTGGAQFTLVDGEISNNISSGNGGGIYASGNNAFIMNGGKITKNIASADGGGVNASSSNTNYPGFIMQGGEITGNKANTGGGIWIYGGNDIRKTGGIVAGKPTNLSGLTQDDCNEATYAGHTLYLYNNYQHTITIGGVSRFYFQDDFDETKNTP